MHNITRCDLQEVFQFLQQLNTIVCLPEFPAKLSSILPMVIKSDLTVIAGTVADLVSSFRNDPKDDQVGNQTLSMTNVHLLTKTNITIPHILKSSVTIHYLSTGDGSEKKISNFLNELEIYQREALYEEGLQPLGRLDQMSLVVTKPKPLMQEHSELDSSLISNCVIKTTPSSVCPEEEFADLVVIIHRDHRNFSERDREILNLLCPHILQAYKNSQMIRQRQLDREQLQQVLEQTNSVVIHRDGSIKLVTVAAEKLMQKYFTVSPYEKDNLPETIKSWLHNRMTDWSADADVSAPTQPLRVIQDNQTLVVRLSVDAENNQYLLTLEEREPLDLSFPLLQKLGLSKRESEILHWIFRDKSNQKISEILNLSNRTVQKHCENIYSRLGVNSRAAMITQIFQKLGVAIFR